MDEKALEHSKRDANVDYKAAVAQLFTEINQLNAQMHQDQAEIDRLKFETNVLKGEMQRLKSETRAILTRLGAAL